MKFAKVSSLNSFLLYGTSCRTIINCDAHSYELKFNDGPPVVRSITELWCIIGGLDSGFRFRFPLSLIVAAASSSFA